MTQFSQCHGLVENTLNSDKTVMIFICLFCCFATSDAFNPSHRGEFASSQDTTSLNLVEGDIVLPERQLRSAGGTLSANLVDETALWPKGFIRYRFETDDFGDGPEPVFSDAQIENITQALQKISTGVPCIDFE